MPIAVTNRAHFNTAAEQWPGPTNTGVPAGTSLTPHSGNLETTSNNQVIDSLDITGSLVVNHSGVIARKCKIIAPASEIAAVFIATGASGTLLVEDCELSNSNKAGGAGIFYDPGASPPAVTVRRLNIHSAENAVGCLSNFDMRDSWVHDLDPAGGDPHTDGLQTAGGVSNVNIIHNTFDMRAPGTGPNNSCVQLDVNAATNVNWLVESNRLLLSTSNGGACVRIPNVDATGNNIRVRNNRMLPGLFGFCIPDPPSTITEWSGNVNDDTGVPVP